ncbi:TPA: hypothetical protein ACH3X1_009220 [Trebouxia sp. C0004]
MSTSLDISIETAKAPVVSTGVSEQMRAINVDTSASSVLDEPRQTGDGSYTQIQSKQLLLLQLRSVLLGTRFLRLAAKKAVELAAQRAAAVDSDPEGPDTNPSGSAAEWSNEDMAAAMAKISELEAANAGLEASAKKKDATLGNISAMSLE